MPRRLRRDPKVSIPAEVTQAVAFPLFVRGPRQLRSVETTDDREPPIEIPDGQYDVLVCFYPAKRKARRVMIEFCPSRSLDAPKCIRMQESTPPKRVVVADKGVRKPR